MRWMAAVVLGLVVCATAQAQLGAVAGVSVMPSPIGVVLTVGKWIWDSASRQQVYSVEVAGTGPDETAARNNGFRLAVESALGSLISSETVVQNGRVERDEIISYAAGFVDRFETVDVRRSAVGITVTMRVWVKRTALADRLLNRTGQSGQIDGARASIQLQTINTERVTGDRLFQTVLNDFPSRAFDIKMEPTNVNRQNRTAVLDMVFQLAWNQDYLRSLWAALDATRQHNATPVATIVVAGGTLFGRWGGRAQFDDAHKLALLVNTMIISRPALLVTVRAASGENLWSSCFLLQELDHEPDYWINDQRFVRVGSNWAQINSTYRYRGSIQIPITPTTLARASTTHMDIVTRNNCPNQ